MAPHSPITDIYRRLFLCLVLAGLLLGSLHLGQLGSDLGQEGPTEGARIAGASSDR